MKHETTSRNTKKALADSLKRLMRQKPFSKVSVSEIITDCGVNRKTFYYHFEDVYALLKWIFEQEAIEVVAHFHLIVDYKEAIDFVMDYVEANEYMIACAYDSIGRDEMKRFFYADFIGILSNGVRDAAKKAAVPRDDDYLAFLSEFYSEALAGILIDYFKEKKMRDKTQTKKYLIRIIRTTIDTIAGDNVPADRKNG